MPSVLRTIVILVSVVGPAAGCGRQLLADEGPTKPPVDVAAMVRTVEEGARGEKLTALRQLRQAAVQEQLGIHKQKVIRQCAELMQDKDGDLSEAACGVLSWLDAEAVPPLVEALQSQDLGVRSDAARLISRIASCHPSQVDKMDAAIPHLAKLLKGTPEKANTARHNAFYAISELGPRAIPQMIAALDAEEYFQWVMMKGFVRHGDQSIEPLCKVLRNGDVTTRRNAVFMLFHISWRAPDVLPILEQKGLGPLTEAIGDDDQVVRSRAIDTLGRMERGAKPVLDKIIAVLDQPDAPFSSIAGAAQRIGPEAKHLKSLFEGAERMAATTTNDRYRVRVVFGPAIAAIGESCVEGVTLALDDRREAVRQTAMFALLSLGPKAAPAVSAVIRRLDDGDQLAPAVLGAIGPKAEAAIPHLIRRLEQGEWERPRKKFDDIYHSPNADALAAIGPSAVPALLEGLKHKNDHVKAGCLAALAKMDPKAMVPLSPIEPLCRHERAVIRLTALQVLVQHGLPEDRLKAIREQMKSDTHKGLPMPR